jgi:choline dehydrogenase
VITVAFPESIPDYLVIGAGSAGCVLAERLSADGSAEVLLVEAGGPDPQAHPEIRVPMLFPRMFGHEDVDWGYRTAPQTGLGGRSVPFPRGKGLGGSSLINAQLWTVGHPADYDGWAAEGLDGWGYADVLPAFAKSTAERTRLAGIRYPSPVTADFLSACALAGYAPAGEVQDGYLLARATHSEGLRWSSADGYLGAAKDRPNLSVLTDGRVLRVLFEGVRAVGVELADGDGVRRIHARREVILAAGAIASPHLLMLSGVGPAGHLAGHGLPVLVDSPQVGRCLQDHLLVPLAFSARGFTSPGVDAGPEEMAQYLKDREGDLDSIVSEALIFLRSSEHLAAPDIEVVFLLLPYGEHESSAKDGLALGVLLLRPRSRGSVTLRSADPYDAPVIDPAYLSDPGGDDIRTLIRGLRKAQGLLAQDVLAKWVGEPLTPGALSEDEAVLEEYVRRTGLSLFHPVSTCRMGADPGSVTDPSFRVRGTEGLRVIDASSMPSIVRAHTHAPVTMLAERAAELILAERSAAPAARGR